MVGHFVVVVRWMLYYIFFFYSKTIKIPVYKFKSAIINTLKALIIDIQFLVNNTKVDNFPIYGPFKYPSIQMITVDQKGEGWGIRVVH